MTQPAINSTHKLLSIDPHNEYRSTSPEEQSKSPHHPTQVVLNTQAVGPRRPAAPAANAANKGRGTLKMATGSGKTITALAIAAELYEQIQLEALIV
ncbi:MAG: DEAD/DEAH box helicase family protein, partial [Planctomycetota bacterium]